jgi:environmental stress-induced protein Ves
MKIVRQVSFVATRWKNGGGITREAIRVPPVGDPFGWRVSVAQIDASGPFSDFSGYHRKIVLLRGAGVRLTFANGDRALLREVGDLVEFDGAIATYGELVAGTCTDLNLIVSQARHTVRVQVQCLDAAVTLDPADGASIVVFAVTGAVLVENALGESASLDPWDLAIGSPQDDGIHKLASVNAGEPARVLLARITDTAANNGRWNDSNVR